MPPVPQIPWDWLSAQQRLGQGRVSDPSQDRLSAGSMPAWWWEQQRYRESQTPGLIPRPQDVQALEFGSMGDPVSQLAFLAAPGLVRGGKALLETAAQPGPSRLMRGGMLASERGNLGPPPMSATGEALPESMVRDETGQLQRLYHGTSRVFPDFDMAQSGSGAGGDLYGPGLYMTASPRIAGEYATREFHPLAQEWLRELQYHAESRAYYESLLVKDPTRTNVLPHIDFAQQRSADLRQKIMADMEQWPGLYEPANIRPVYADLKRPFDADTDMIDPQALGTMARKTLDAWGKTGNATAETLLKHAQNTSTPLTYDVLASAVGKEEANKTLQRLGYDGITHIGSRVTGGQPHRVYIAFSPEQVYPSVNVDALRGMSTRYPK